jgi:uncharacterized protein YecE (DUF72 family)
MEGEELMGFQGVGIGGWIYPPWRGTFYPKGLRQADELTFASQTLSALEINATYHKLHGPEDFARWGAQTPPEFRFAVKASRLCTNRRVLAETGEAVTRFLGQGLVELGPRLGPILWQFMPTKKFERDDFARFLDLLPEEIGGRRLSHALEPRHISFVDEGFVDLCRARGAAICVSDHATYPLIEARTADFSYARLMRLDEALETGYPLPNLDAWARRLRAHARGGDLYAFFIGSGEAGKIRAPAAALALQERLQNA